MRGTPEVPGTICSKIDKVGIYVEAGKRLDVARSPAPPYPWYLVRTAGSKAHKKASLGLISSTRAGCRCLGAPSCPLRVFRQDTSLGSFLICLWLYPQNRNPRTSSSTRKIQGDVTKVRVPVIFKVGYLKRLKL